MPQINQYVGRILVYPKSFRQEGDHLRKVLVVGIESETRGFFTMKLVCLARFNKALDKPTTRYVMDDNYAYTKIGEIFVVKDYGPTHSLMNMLRVGWRFIKD